MGRKRILVTGWVALMSCGSPAGTHSELDDGIWPVTDTMVVSDGGFYARIGSDPVGYYPNGCADFCADVEKATHVGTTSVTILSCAGPAPIESHCDPTWPDAWAGCGAFAEVVFDGGVVRRLDGPIDDGGAAIQCRAQMQVRDTNNGCQGPALIPY
jgi:hypothetical protein